MSKAVLQGTRQKPGPNRPGLGWFRRISIFKTWKGKQRLLMAYFRWFFRTNGLTSSCLDWALEASWGLGYPSDSYTVWFSYAGKSDTAVMVALLPGNLTDFLGMFIEDEHLWQVFQRLSKGLCGGLGRLCLIRCGVGLEWTLTGITGR